jgi:hypothetical protein
MSILNTTTIALENDKSLILTQEMPMESLVSQLQSMTNKILVVENGSYLTFYDKAALINDSKKRNKQSLEHKQERNGVMEYYFRDSVTESLYCLFGAIPAKIWFPALDEDQLISIPPEERADTVQEMTDI